MLTFCFLAPTGALILMMVYYFECQMFKCSNVPMFQCVFLFMGSQEFLVHWSIGSLVHWSIESLVYWSIGPLVPWSLGPLVHWSIGWMSNVKCKMSYVKCQKSNQMSIRLNFCRSIPSEFLRSFSYHYISVPRQTGPEPALSVKTTL